MINPQVFGEGMAILTDRFNRSLHPATSRLYFQILSGELDTEQFEVGVRMSVRYSQFWPSPQQIIDYAIPEENPDFEAIEAFEKIRNLGEVIPGRTMVWRLDKVRELGEPAVAGFKAIGSNEGMQNLESKNLRWMREAFITTYKLKLSEIRQAQRIAAARRVIAQKQTQALNAGNA